MTGIKELADISTDDIERLYNAGVRTAEQLLELGSTPTARHRLADDTTIDDSYITYLVHLADLVRVKDLSPALAQTLYDQGVTTVAKLAFRSARALHAELVAAEASMIPGVAELQEMISAAKTLNKAVYH